MRGLQPQSRVRNPLQSATKVRYEFLVHHGYRETEIATSSQRDAQTDRNQDRGSEHV